MKRPFLLLALVVGCVDTAQHDARADLYVAGTALPALTARDGTEVTLTRAELAFGPLTLCAGVQAGELCDDALVEWLDATVVDALSDVPQRAGTLSGVTGRAQSFMYDLGLVSLLTSDRPYVTDAARRLGQTSVRVAGRAARDGRTLTFSVAVAIAQGDETERGVPVVRKSASDVFSHRLASRGDELLVRFDARPWVADVDFAALFARCEVDLDCANEITLEGESQAGSALRNALLAGARPSFTWNFDDE